MTKIFNHRFGAGKVNRIFLFFFFYVFFFGHSWIADTVSNSRLFLPFPVANIGLDQCHFMPGRQMHFEN